MCDYQVLVCVVTLVTYLLQVQVMWSGFNQVVVCVVTRFWCVWLPDSGVCGYLGYQVLVCVLPGSGVCGYLGYLLQVQVMWSGSGGRSLSDPL